MSVIKSLEANLLSKAEMLLSEVALELFIDNFEARLQILEACASLLGGFELKDYQKKFKIKALYKSNVLLQKAFAVISAIKETPIHPTLALSALARETLKESHRKTTGAYHTDFRLAQRLAEHAAKNLNHTSKVIDPACGTGILLAALTIKVCGNDKRKISKWFSHGVYAADLSSNSLRGTLIALSSLTDDLKALKKMRDHWYCGDSLLADQSVWSAMTVDGFDAVIGNPPWEKIKLTRHEFLRSNGGTLHYGGINAKINKSEFDKQKNDVANYSRTLINFYPELERGEPDLYIAFTSLFSSLCRSGGTISALVPGGLIRSKGTDVTRQKLFKECQSITISIIDNRARFFEIDSRFKFLAITLIKNTASKRALHSINLLHERGLTSGLAIYGTVKIPKDVLLAIRSDLSIPEVRDTQEWEIFQKVSQNGCAWEDSRYGWNAHFCREVDMTKEKPYFRSKPSLNSLAVIEGRMVQQHRFGAKGYVSGTGRRATWTVFPVGTTALKPQFWLDERNISSATLIRSNRVRAGFCDIAGQTNERSLMAAIIPSGVICGNKVPTVVFPNDLSEDRLLAWVAVVNSFSFDWMLRRILTTTVNYFILQSVPLPKLTKNGLPWRKIVACAKELARLGQFDDKRLTSQRVSMLRAEIDTEIAIAYGLTLQDLEVMLLDFPSLDRGQPPLNGEERSTITRDTLLATAAKRLGENNSKWQERLEVAKERGAVGYVPSETVNGIEEAVIRTCECNYV